MDHSNGYESISYEFMSHRSAEIGVTEVRSWARTLQKGSSVIDLGCGPGLPLTSTLVTEGLEVFGLDASPSLVNAFRRNLPGTPVLCEPVQTSHFFHRSFDAAVAWGLISLLTAEEQDSLIKRLAEILSTGGRFLFTSPARAGTWNDAMTGRASLSLGTEEYRKLLNAVCISVQSEYEDEGGNHYYDAIKD